MKKQRVPGVMTIREKRCVYLLFMAGDSIEAASRKVGKSVWWGVVNAEQALRDFWTGKMKIPQWTQPTKRTAKG